MITHPRQPENNADFYVTGGTLRSDAPSYVERAADRELFDALKRGEFCYVLTSRQMGKSSLMIRTANRLREQGIAVAVLDLQALGQNLTPEQWYDGLLNLLARALDLEEAMEAYWFSHERLSPLQRWMQALGEVVLECVPGPVVLFVDEIDAVRSLPFSADEFFAGIRECYNRRTESPEYTRLSFCLLGVASPSDLITDTRNTPFNIGKRIELRDFTPQEAQTLAEGLSTEPPNGTALLSRILYWTGGHPYLTQRLCQAVVETGQAASSKEVDRRCAELFFSARAQESEDNLLFVREWLLRQQEREALLKLYGRLRQGENVADAQGDRLLDLLRLSGIARVDKHRLKVRNRIYARVFDSSWVLAHLPQKEPARVSPTNLTAALSSFVGRDKEIEVVQNLLGRARALTLVGSGGCGKTRLAIEVGRQWLESYADGVWLVELAGLSEGSLVAQSVASCLGLREEPGRSLLETVGDFVKSKRLLLILDNCEHLLSSCALVVETLLRNGEHAQVLATSREALRVEGEQVFQVPSLSMIAPEDLPEEEKEIASIVMEYEAPRLFVERAALQQYDFALTHQNAPVVASICYRLDGIPLAIELAAARVSTLSVEEIAAHLQDRFALLVGGRRAALPRQQTLQALIDWSYELLSQKERALLSRLSVFAGGWNAEDAEGVCAGEGIEIGEVGALLKSLVDKSLVNLEGRAGRDRYRMLEMIREYAREKLQQTGQEKRWRDQHLEFFLALAEQAQPKLQGAEQAEWLERLESEHDNLRAAVLWCQQDIDKAETGLRLAVALGRFFEARGYYGEDRGYLQDALNRLPAHIRSSLRVKVLNGLGLLARLQGDYAAARSFHEQCLEVSSELGDEQGIATSLNAMGTLVREQGDYASARELYEQSLAIKRQIGDKPGIANSLTNLGLVAEKQADYERARALYAEGLALRRELRNMAGIAASLMNLGNLALLQGNNEQARHLYEEGLAINKEVGNKQGIAYLLGNLGIVARRQSDFEQARSCYEQTLVLCKEIGDQLGIAHTLCNLADLAMDRGDYAAARALHAESLSIKRESGNMPGIIDSLESMADLASRRRQAERAARLWGVAEALREAIGSPRPPQEQEEYDRQVASARADISSERFAFAWEEGHRMTVEQAVEYALQEA